MTTTFLIQTLLWTALIAVSVFGIFCFVLYILSKLPFNEDKHYIRRAEKERK